MLTSAEWANLGDANLRLCQQQQYMTGTPKKGNPYYAICAEPLLEQGEYKFPALPL